MESNSGRIRSNLLTELTSYNVCWMKRKFLSMATNDPIALITGASSGFGLLTAVTLAERGWRVIATMRDLERRSRLEEAARAAGVLDRIEILLLDVNDAAQIAALAATMAVRPVHAIVNNAGFAMAGFCDDVSDAELRRQFDTNFFAYAAVTRAFLPQLRQQGFGHIVMVSSISGRVGFPGIGSYVASKHALEGWTESLRLEMLPLGIQVALVEPGSFETGIWTRGAVVCEAAQEAVLDHGRSDDTGLPPIPPSTRKEWGAERSLGTLPSPNVDRMKKLVSRVLGSKKRPNPQIVADCIARILKTPRPRPRYVVGADARHVLLLRTLLPWRLYEQLIVKASGIGE
jgi:NAD(P)-dependent dehydrogenase (short-subunit alcohol dehydrogenase family)